MTIEVVVVVVIVTFYTVIYPVINNLYSDI